jgi:hypothetical protein
MRRMNKQKFFDILGYGLVAAGVALNSFNSFLGTFVVGLGIGYSIRPFIQRI